MADEKWLEWGCSDCTPGNPAWVPDDVDVVLASYNDEQDEATGYCLVVLKDGRFGVSIQSSDYTGHG